jgi:hypothetical protein
LLLGVGNGTAGSNCGEFVFADTARENLVFARGGVEVSLA